MILSISLLLTILQSSKSFTSTSESIGVETIRGEGTVGSCPSQESRDTAIQNLRATIQIVAVKVAPIIDNCGPGVWYRVARLNMSDPSQQCPSAWVEYNTSGVRACGISNASNASCPGISYATSRQYSRVCGRAIGYQIGSTDAFGFQTVEDIDSYYLFGVSITHGSPRNHIWSYSSGLSEGRGTSNPQGNNCPCSNPDHPSNNYPPSFVGDNYYCESGNPTDGFTRGLLYSDDPIWDGQQCEGQCCSSGRSPPWFSAQLPNPTTDDIEVRICSALPSGDNTPIQLLELYVQQ